MREENDERTKEDTIKAKLSCGKGSYDDDDEFLEHYHDSDNEVALALLKMKKEILQEVRLLFSLRLTLM